MNFVFYDTETTGTNTYFDQILQFAAILTDSDFKEIDRFEIRCKIQPHIIPAPMALIITHVSIDQLTDSSLPSHYEMVQQIKEKLEKWSPAIFIGYNSISFDETLLRQAFYQTLNPPYLTSMNSNTRTDLLQIVRATSVYAPDVLSIPINDKGKQIFKLDQLAPLNGFSHENAHDALNDVEATIYLAKLIRTKAPFIWKTFLHNSHKKGVTDFIESNMPIFVQTEFYYNRPYPFLVTPLGSNPNNKSEVFTLNLAHNPVELSNMNDTDLGKIVASSPTPVRSVKTNSVPTLFTVADTPSDLLDRTSVSVDEAVARAELVQMDQILKNRLIEAKILSRGVFKISPYVEEQIYDGFFSWADQALMNDFHTADWNHRLIIVENFEDPRLRQLGERLIYLEQPDVLDSEAQIRIEKIIKDRLISQKKDIPWRTISMALEELEKSKELASRKSLIDIENFLKDRTTV